MRSTIVVAARSPDLRAFSAACWERNPMILSAEDPSRRRTPAAARFCSASRNQRWAGVDAGGARASCPARCRRDRASAAVLGRVSAGCVRQSPCISAGRATQVAACLTLRTPEITERRPVADPRARRSGLARTDRKWRVRVLGASFQGRRYVRLRTGVRRWRVTERDGV